MARKLKYKELLYLIKESVNVLSEDFSSTDYKKNCNVARKILSLTDGEGRERPLFIHVERIRNEV